MKTLKHETVTEVYYATGRGHVKVDMGVDFIHYWRRAIGRISGIHTTHGFIWVEMHETS